MFTIVISSKHCRYDIWLRIYGLIRNCESSEQKDKFDRN